MAGNPGSRVSIIALGLRGLPNVPGGVEMHASELYPRLQKLGAKVTVLGRSPFRPANAPPTWQGVSVHWLPCPRIQGVEALVHTFFGVLYAAVHRPDVLHVHAVGPWLMVPLAKLLGLKVVVTHHGQDYLRERWSAPVRSVLRLGERWGMSFADERIVISKALLDLARVKYRRKVTLIPNGVSNPQPCQSLHLLEKYGLTPQRYIIQVSRFVPEKRQLDLTAAFNAAHLCGWKLLLVGGAQGSQRYADLVHQQISGNEAIINTGFLSSPEVQELLSQAGIFVLPSSHEGLPISLLEAMKLGTPVVASDIPANREIRLDECDYFPVGDIAALERALCRLAAATAEERALISTRLIALCEYYNWDAIAVSTMKVMERLAHRHSPVLWDRTTPASPH